MVNISRVRAEWTGFPGAPGISTFYGISTSPPLAAIHNFFAAIVGLLPSDVSIQVAGSGDMIDPINGDLMGTWSGTAPALVTGTDTGVYSAPTGAIVHWLTGDVLDGHRLVGGTYLVPLAGAAFDLTGSIASTPLTTLRTAAQDYITYAGGSTVVWHRPRVAKAATAYKPAVTARAGGYSVFSAADVPDRAVVLRSRRD